MKEKRDRGFIPSVKEEALRGEIFSSDIDVQRVTDQESGAEVIYVRVNPDMHDWQNTEIGRLKVDPIKSYHTRSKERMVRSVRIHFDSDSELRQKGNGEQKYKRRGFRELSLNESGDAWQQLRRKVSDRRKSQGSKWLCIVFDQPSYVEPPSYQDGM